MENGSNSQTDKLTDTITGRLVLFAIGASGILGLAIWFYLLW
jgi:hypothetical protein